jgi:hypothetical protein
MSLPIATRDGRVLTAGTPEFDAYVAERSAERDNARKAELDEERDRVGPLFERLADIAENWDGRAIPWVVPDMVFYGGVTMVSGSPKSGKSTLVADLVRAREQRDLWLERNVAGGTTILLTEEGGYPVVNRWKSSGDLVVMQHHVAAAHYRLDQQSGMAPKRGSFLDWVMERLRDALDDTADRPLVIIDTLAVWSGIEDENDASQTTQAVALWTELASRTGAAVILVHHSRKGGGQFGESIRGSTAILATVAMSVELSHISAETDDRRLDVRGRLTFGERLRLSFDRESGRYSLSDADTTARPRAALVEQLAELPSTLVYSSGGITANEAKDFWNISKQAAVDRLTVMVAAGLVTVGPDRVVRGNLARTWQAVQALPPGFHDRSEGDRAAV